MLNLPFGGDCSPGKAALLNCNRAPLVWEMRPGNVLPNDGQGHSSMSGATHGMHTHSASLLLP